MRQQPPQPEGSGSVWRGDFTGLAYQDLDIPVGKKTRPIQHQKPLCQSAEALSFLTVFGLHLGPRLKWGVSYCHDHFQSVLCLDAG
jgi:hypothetical protein